MIKYLSEYKENLCPQLHYRKYSGGLVLTACYGVDGTVILPDAIDGEPITAIAPYAFSEGVEAEDDLVWQSKEAGFLPDKRRLKTTDITEIWLPEGITEIGRYAFYRCSNLKKLVLSDGILDIGGGALNGCRALREIEIHFHRGERSALKSIVDEVRFAIHARLYYPGVSRPLDTDGDADDRVADILFPEHYEEAVENTPARILYTSHHGAGGYYRQCFYNRELDYKKYDELLVRAVAEETEETVIRLALGRLIYPYKLSLEAKENYETYIKEHMKAAAIVMAESEDIGGIKYLGRNHFWTAEALEAGIENASRLNKTDILSLFMDEKRKCGPRKKKSFEL